MGYLNAQPGDDYLLQATAERGTSAMPAPGAFEGLGQAVGQGVAGAADSITNSLIDVGGAIAHALPTGVEHALEWTPFQSEPGWQKYVSQQRDDLEQWVKSGKQFQGSAAQTAGGVAKGLSTFALSLPAGAASPYLAATLMGGTAADDTYRDLTAQGVDSKTAAEAAAAQGAIGAAGAVVPFKFGSLFSRVAGSAAVNVGLGAASRTANWAALKAGGYDQMADAQKPLDAQSVMADLIIGAGMGVGAHLHETYLGSHEPLPHQDRPPPSQVDAARVVKDQTNIADSAPGVPTSPEVADVHAQAFHRFLGDILEGKNPELAVDEARALSEGTIDSPKLAESASAIGEWTHSYPEVQQAESIGALLDEARANLDKNFPDFAAMRETQAAAETGNPGSEQKQSVTEGSGLATPDEVDEANLRQLEAAFPNEQIPQEDGTMKSVREMADEMRANVANAESDNALMHAAVACFARTGVSL